MRTLVILAAAIAAAAAAPRIARADLARPPAAAETAFARTRSRFGLHRGAGGRGVMLREAVSSQSALGVTVSSGPRREVPEVRVILGFLYSF